MNCIGRFSIIIETSVIRIVYTAAYVLYKLSRDGSHRDNFGEVSRLCQLSSHSRVFLSKLQIFESMAWISLGGGGGGFFLIFVKFS